MLDQWIDRDDRQSVIVSASRGDGRPKRLTNRFDQNLRLLGRTTALGEDLEDAHEVPDGDALVEQITENALDLRQ